MKVAVMSDIHGNLEAFDSIRRRICGMEGIEGIVLLGDLIDYGPHSDEVIESIQNLPYPALPQQLHHCGLYHSRHHKGNHQNQQGADH